MKNKICILWIVAFILGGCYKDKGNYNYKEVNNLELITFTPEPTEQTETSLNYRYRQPSLDTLKVTYTPVLTQSGITGEDNLEFQWITSKTINKKTVLDTLRSKELTLKFAPKTKTSYAPLFRVIDHSTDVEYYTKFNMNTVVPFVNSYFVLHGESNKCKLAVIQGVNEINEEPSIIYDVYEEIWGIRRFQEASSLIYFSKDGVDYDAGIIEHIIVVSKDSCWYMHPFDLVVTKRFELMLPNMYPRPKLTYGVGNGTEAAFLVDDNGHLYWAKGLGYFFPVKTNEDTKGYHASKVFLSESDYATVWDEEQKRFMFYNMKRCPWSREESYIHPEDETGVVLTLFDEGIFMENEWLNKRVVWIGQGNNNFSEKGSTVVAVDGKNNYTVYQIALGNSVKVNKIPVPNMKLQANSQLATSFAFQDQIFYSRDECVYLYNMASGEEIFLYDAGGPITKLCFRIAHEYDDGYGSIDANRRLVVVVNKTGGMGEVHDVFLNIAGDIMKTTIHSGFGSIKDIIFSSPGVVR